MSEIKYSLLSVSTVPAINIGDYIQALAARQFLPRVDSYIEREHLKDYDGERTNVIMNAYYMHDAQQWPPSDKINPLLVSVHINILARDKMLSNEGLEYFKKYQPIGCRDYETEKMLLSCGIKAYFSGCMTLTLGKQYKSSKKNEKIYFVDVKLPIERPYKLKLLIKSLFYFGEIRSLSTKLSTSIFSNCTIFENWCKSANLYLSFKKLMDKDLILNAEYLTQEDIKYNLLPNNDARMEAAESLVRKYASASLVITSRIHCALPCLAVETPVYYVYDDNMPLFSSCRLDGLVQLFNVIHWTGKELKSNFASNLNKISLKNIIPNSKEYVKYSEELSSMCEKFINSCRK